MYLALFATAAQPELDSGLCSVDEVVRAAALSRTINIQSFILKIIDNNESILSVQLLPVLPTAKLCFL